MNITDYDLLKFCEEDFKLDTVKYNQDALMFKPKGLWVTLNEVDNWEDWCVTETFCLHKLQVIKHLRFKVGANILVINNKDEFLHFEERFANSSLLGIDWAAVCSHYQGILITKYFWGFRFKRWYYPWDCVSECIWDTSCLEENFSEANPKIKEILQA